MSEYQGSDWVEHSLWGSNPSPNMSEAGRMAADLLGDVWRGIYHLPIGVLRKVDWSNEWGVELSIPGDLATVDDNKLTLLVVLAHDRMLRVEIAPCNMQYLKLYIHRRMVREGSLSQRCPTLEDHVVQIRKVYGGPE